jgi:hypothetical protein
MTEQPAQRQCRVDGRYACEPRLWLRRSAPLPQMRELSPRIADLSRHSPPLSRTNVQGCDCHRGRHPLALSGQDTFRASPTAPVVEQASRAGFSRARPASGGAASAKMIASSLFPLAASRGSSFGCPARTRGLADDMLRLYENERRPRTPFMSVPRQFVEDTRMKPLAVVAPWSTRRLEGKEPHA